MTALKQSAPAPRLLAWFARHKRALPWRAVALKQADPYPIWVSEIMLQQTRVETVIPYFNAFIRRFPDIPALARARRDSVLRLWAGLGYYRRAHHLHQAAKEIVKTHGGKLPDEEKLLRRLPGIGVYSAAAIAAIAFNRPAIAIDGNLIRLFSRLLALETSGPARENSIREQAASWLPRGRAGDYAQALMELGALVCTPRKPACPACPLAQHCRAYALGRVEDFPLPVKKSPRPVRYGVLFHLARPDGRILLRRREARGLLGGMMAFPSSPWQTEPPPRPLAHAPLAGLRWVKKPGMIRHVFTHFELRLTGFAACVCAAQAKSLPGIWANQQEMEKLALPSLMRKAARHMVD